MVSFISSCIVSFVVNLLFFLFFSRVYKKKYKNNVLYIVSYFGASILMILINQLNEPYFNIAYTFLSANAVCMLLFDGKLKKSLLYNNLFVLILFFSDVITTIIWAIIHGETLVDILSSYQLMLISNLLNILIMVLSYRIFVLVLSKNEIYSIRLKEAVFLILMTIYETFFIGAYAIKVSSRIDGIYILCILFGFLGFNLFVTYIIREISEAYRYKYELSVSKRQIEMQLAHYKDTNLKYQEAMKIAHDVKKHLATLKGLKSSDEARAEKYSSLVEDKVDELFCKFHCTNEILSIVMSQKITTAEELKTKVNTKVENVLLDFMDDLDITAIFSNLWDNAIEACSKIEIKSRFINFNMEKVNDFIVLSVENSYEGKVIGKNEKILSTKKNHNGIGLGIIKSTVEKYNGVFKTKYDKNVFRSEITIPIPNK